MHKLIKLYIFYGQQHKSVDWSKKSQISPFLLSWNSFIQKDVIFKSPGTKLCEGRIKMVVCAYNLSPVAMLLK
jgi:hypothetical protein